jgi:citrate lyase beta subunit
MSVQMKTPSKPLPPRSMLFVSGEKPERFAKAMASGADLVCIDLEDAVHPAVKDSTRYQVLEWLGTTEHHQQRIALRINSLRTLDGLRDIKALVDSGLSIDWLLLPKTACAADVQCINAWLGTQIGAIAALIETPQGIEHLAEIAGAGGKIGALMLGGADLATELNARFAWEPLLFARCRLINAAKSRGLEAWDVPHIDLDALDELALETRRALALGFDCKSAIHPKQLSIIHAAHLPTEADLAWANLLVAAVPSVADDGSEQTGAFLFQGKMVDAPLLRKARHIVAVNQRSFHGAKR